MGRNKSATVDGESRVAQYRECDLTMKRILSLLPFIAQALRERRCPTGQLPVVAQRGIPGSALGLASRSLWKVHRHRRAKYLGVFH